MIAETVINNGCNDIRKDAQALFADCVIYGCKPLGHYDKVLDTAELLTRLDEKGIRPTDIAKVLGVSPSRVTEIKKGQRSVKLDEAVKLVAAFDLELPPVQRVPPLPAPIARLVVQYVAMELNCDLSANQERIADLSEDVRAFAEFVTDPKVRGSVEGAEAFFRAMQLRRPREAEEGPPGTSPEQAH